MASYFFIFIKNLISVNLVKKKKKSAYFSYYSFKDLIPPADFSKTKITCPLHGSRSASVPALRAPPVKHHI